MSKLRQTAIRARISDITTGKFVRKEGLEPSYVLSELGQRISRAKLLGTVVDKFMSEDGNYSTITIDDDSDSIRIKAFRENVNLLKDIELGDLVMIIGKVREYAGENYIIPDIVKKVANPNYECLHKLEILKELLKQRKVFDTIKKEKERFGDPEELKKYVEKEYRIKAEKVDSILELFSLEEETKEVDYKPLVLETLEKLDKGDGVEFKKLLEETKLPDNVFEEVINDLLSSGICYEPKPGMLKKA